MKFRVKVGETAKKDARAIRRYIAEQFHAPKTAEEYFERIANAVISLREMPERYRLFYDTAQESEKWKNLRVMIVGSYKVFYTVSLEKKEVFVRRILYGKRDFVKILENDSRIR